MGKASALHSFPDGLHHWAAQACRWLPSEQVREREKVIQMEVTDWILISEVIPYPFDHILFTKSKLLVLVDAQGEGVPQGRGHWEPYHGLPLISLKSLYPHSNPVWLVLSILLCHHSTEETEPRDLPQDIELVCKEPGSSFHAL